MLPARTFDLTHIPRYSMASSILGNSKELNLTFTSIRTRVTHIKIYRVFEPMKNAVLRA